MPWWPGWSCSQHRVVAHERRASSSAASNNGATVASDQRSAVRSPSCRKPLPQRLHRATALRADRPSDRPGPPAQSARCDDRPQTRARLRPAWSPRDSRTPSPRAAAGRSLRSGSDTTTPQTSNTAAVTSHRLGEIRSPSTTAGARAEPFRRFGPSGPAFVLSASPTRRDHHPRPCADRDDRGTGLIAARPGRRGKTAPASTPFGTTARIGQAKRSSMLCRTNCEKAMRWNGNR